MWTVALTAVHAATVEVVRDGQPTAAVVLGDNATRIERHAAEELCAYVERMTGAQLPIRSVASGQWPVVSDQSDIILIGRAETNPLVKQLVDAGAIRLSAETPGLDGFIIQTTDYGPQTTDNDGRVLVLGGSDDRGTLYAVYHLLEKVCHVGFFLDGDYVPRAASLSFDKLDIAQRPRWPDRENWQGCPFDESYFLKYCGADFWSFDRWQRECDWMAKKKLNLAMLPEDEALLDYARGQLGLRDVQNGHDHYYGVGISAVENPNVPVTEKIRADCARAEENLKRDPQAFWVTSGWDFLASGVEWQLGCNFAPPPHGWTEETIRAYVRSMPGEGVIMDLWAEEVPLYKQYDYLYGAQWAFGVIHSYGYDETMHGKMAELIDRVQDVSQDPRANRCRGIYIQPEIVHDNPIYYDLVCELAWDPAAVELNSYLEDVALRRYGAQSAPTMRRCLDELVQSVYGPLGDSGYPLYRAEPMPDWIEGGDLRVLELSRLPFPHHLAAALDAALRERDREAENPLYENDVFDIARQLISELYNVHMGQLFRAFEAGDRPAFEAERGVLVSILDDLQLLLSSRPDFWVGPMIDEIMKLPRDHQKIFQQLDEKTPDFVRKQLLFGYAAMDPYEVVRYVYRPRMDAYFDGLSAALGHGSAAIDRESIRQQWEQINEKWRTSRYAIAEEDKYSGSPLDAVEAVLGRLRPMVDAIPIISGPSVVPGDRVGWREEFRSTDGWTLRSQDGSTWQEFLPDHPPWHPVDPRQGCFFVTDGDVATLRSVRNWFVAAKDELRPSRWEPQGGQWTLQDGQYVTSGRGEEYSLVGGQFDNLVLDVDQRTEDGIGQSLLLFRAQDLSNFYAVRVAAYVNDWWTLEKRVKGQTQVLARGELPGNQVHPLGTPWHIRVRAEGDRIEAELSTGETVYTLSAQDDTFARGRVGLATEFSQRTHWDNLQVEPIGGAQPSAAARRSARWRIPRAGASAPIRQPADGSAHLGEVLPPFEDRFEGEEAGVPIAEYPVLSFRYREVRDSFGLGRVNGRAWVWIIWEDASGKKRRDCLWRGGGSNQWEEVAIRLDRALGLLGKPVRIVGLEIKNQYAPHVTEWDYIRLCSTR